MASSSHYRVTNDLQYQVIENTSDAKLDTFLETVEKATIKILVKSEDELVFDVIGIDAPIANALRRILLAEVCYSTINIKIDYLHR